MTYLSFHRTYRMRYMCIVMVRLTFSEMLIAPEVLVIVVSDISSDEMQ